VFSRVFRGWFVFLAVSSLTLCGVAHAQPTPGDRAAAETLFDEAVKLLEGGDAKGACPKLEESQRLDPGVGTLLYLADCYEQVGRTASAWATFREAAYAARSASQFDREQTASAQAEALRPKLSYVTFAVAAPDTPGLQVKRDGQVVGKALWLSPVPTDPGDHQLEVSAPGKKTWTGAFSVANVPQTTTNVPIPALEDAPPEPVAAVSQPMQAPPPVDQGPRGKTQRTLGWVAGGAGVASLGIAAVFSVLSMSDNKKADEQCLASDPILCNSEGVQLGESAINKANTATVFAGIGGALLATGVVLIFTAPSDPDSARLRVGAQLGSLTGLTLDGAF